MSQLEAEVGELVENLKKAFHRPSMLKLAEREKQSAAATKLILDFLASHTAQESRGEVVFVAHVNKCACAPKCERGQIEGLLLLTQFIGQRVKVSVAPLPPVPQTVNVEEER